MTDGRPFTRENIGAENRINLTLFTLQAVPEFWRPCCKLIGLADGASLERVQINGQSLRPDFRVHDEHGVATAWLEVELGKPDDVQNKNYIARLLPNKVVCVEGRRLKAIAELAEELASTIGISNRPLKTVLVFLARMINDHVDPAARHPAPQLIPGRLLEMPWFQRAMAPLLDLEREGFVENRPVEIDSLSLRLKRGPSIRCANSFALITRRYQYFEVPDPKEMDRIFHGPLYPLVHLWAELLNRALPCWRAQIDGRKRIRIDAKTIEKHADEFADFYAALRDCLMPRSSV